MATHFKGPVVSVNGFTGAIAGAVVGNVTGNVSGTAASITGNLTGDVTSVAMATSLAAAVVTGKLLTGLAAGSDTTIVAGDTILEALAKLQAQIDAL